MHKQKKYRAITPGVAWLLSELQIESLYGREALKNLRPAKSDQLEQLRQSLSELETMVAAARQDRSIFDQAASIFKCLRFINGSLDNLEAGQVPDETELLEIKGFAMMLTSLKNWYDRSGLQLPSVSFSDIEPVIKILNPDRTVVASFHVHEAYSQKLKEIRAEKLQLESMILQCNDQQQRDELRDQRARLVQTEKAEEHLVRENLGRQLLEWVTRMRHNALAAGRFELLLAKTLLACRFNCTCPAVFAATKKVTLQAEEMINPEVETILASHGKQFTPVSIELNPGTTLLTGANMGGKSVALMTLAMNAELATLGFFVFARRFSMPLFDFIYLIAGDGQNQASGLSSFGAEIIRLSELTALTRQGVGLAICDEFARSTNPSEGSRFVQALGEFLQQSGSYGVIATHFDGIRIAEASYYQVIGLKNKTISAAGGDRNSLLNNLCDNMDYRLVRLSDDYQVPKDALHIASILDVDPEFMAILRRHYPSTGE
ncbi:MAG TPA: hypothetical protein PKN29_08275 [Candidatus Ozemobacteraceae bacterium]|nr:hypothetical protein [Candidatus Ozemobacteraceae bacterium]